MQLLKIIILFFRISTCRNSYSLYLTGFLRVNFMLTKSYVIVCANFIKYLAHLSTITSLGRKSVYVVVNLDFTIKFAPHYLVYV